MKEDNSLKLLKSAGVLILTLVFIFIMLVGVLIPRIDAYLSIQKKISEQEERIKVLSDKLAELSSLSEAELFNSASLLMNAIPPQKDFFGLLMKIKSIFQLENVRILSYSLSPGALSSDSGKRATKEKPDNSIRVKVGFSGSFESVERIINRLEESFPLTVVESLSMKADTALSGDQSQNVPSEMIIAGFYLPLPKELGEVGKSIPRISSQNLSLLEKLKGFIFYEVAEATQSGATVTVGKEIPF